MHPGEAMRVAALAVALSAAASTGIPCSAATTYPTKPIRVLAGGAASGPIDIIARVVMQKLAEQVGQPIVIDNRGGAGGMIATPLGGSVAHPIAARPATQAKQSTLQRHSFLNQWDHCGAQPKDENNMQWHAARLGSTIKDCGWPVQE
jgi:tripartite-type tricarboxylate transporter receptor subunit TctC